jgi:cyclohexanone monooxygenase
MSVSIDTEQRGAAADIPRYDAVVIGAGFAGLYAVHRLRDHLGLSVIAFEKGSDVGGTWYWNRYPGARCDIESYNYSYSFSEEIQREWVWSERFAGQPEILRYLNFVADKLALRDAIRFSTTIISAVYDEADHSWVVGTDDGRKVRAQFLVSGAGTLSAPKELEIPGVGDFRGRVYYTSDWPHEGVDFSGLRVGIIGTGASGIQAIPKIAEQAAHLTVFQRTPNYATPLGNGPMDPEFFRLLQEHYREVRTRSRDHFMGVPYGAPAGSALATDPQTRRAIYEEKWNTGGFRLFMESFQDLLFDQEANATAAEFIRDKIRQRVKDPDLARMLSPQDYPYGTKRPPLETGYYETFNRDNVSLVDLRRDPIERIVPGGIQTAQGMHTLDCIVFATGFDAMTGPLTRLGLRGRNGLRLEEFWEHGPRTFLGLMIPGFPNFFTVTGPQSPSVLYNMPLAIEDHVEWIGDCIAYLRGNGIRSIEPSMESADRWGEETASIAAQTLLPRGNSWYMGANVPGKARTCLVYLGGAPRYRQICDDIAAKGYEGFRLEA